MKPTSEILERINKSSENHKDGVFTRLYRYLLREDVYFAAYQKLYSNNGSVTKGIDDDTANGFSIEYVRGLISDLKAGAYKPKPVRRQYIQKSNGKQRPLGIPSFRDKLLQEVVRMFLEAIYEPLFCQQSHGFRPEKSCHTALKQIKIDFHGAKWFIEGDIKGCFDNINHNTLISLLEEKIKDSRFINIIRMFLKAGYMEDFQYHATMSGTPQGGIISPVLANIYLHELDRKIMEMKVKFDKSAPTAQRPEYKRLINKRVHLKKKISNTTGMEREMLIDKYKAYGKEMMSMPAKLEEDKKIVYCRYADDFLIGVFGSKADCENIKRELKTFLADEYSLELSEEKTKITHSSEKIRFLGYDIAVRRNQQIKRRKDGRRARTLNNTVELTIPFEEKIVKHLFKNGIAEQKPNGSLFPAAVPKLYHMSEVDIVRRFDSQFRGICNYYRLAANYNRLIYFQYLMEYSCLKTIAGKHSTSMSKIRRKYSMKDGWGIPYETKTGRKTASMSKISDCKNGKYCDDINPWQYKAFQEYNLTIWKRLKAYTCELCETHDENCKVYHAGNMKNLSSLTDWGDKMLKMNRKTLIVCDKCFTKISENKTELK